MKSKFVFGLLGILGCVIFANLTFAPSSVMAQTTWARTYGGTSKDEAFSIQQTSEGKYIVAGRTESFGTGNSDVWVLKLDETGNVSWQRTYGGTNMDEAFSMQKTSDGGCIVAGGTESFGAGSSDIWVLKLDKTGNVSWQRTYGGTGWDETFSIQNTRDGGYVVAGWTESFGAGGSDIWVLKLDGNGNVIWQRTYGGTSSDGATSIQQTSDGGYIVTGWTASFGAGLEDFWVLKLDENGSVIWQRTYGEADRDDPLSIQQTSDGGYIVAGGTYSFSDQGSGNMWVFKLDGNGSVIWQRMYGGPEWDGVFSIQQRGDGGYIIAGVSMSFNGGTLNRNLGGRNHVPIPHVGIDDVFLLKLDGNGNIIRQMGYGGADFDRAYSIQQTSDGGYIVAGMAQSFGPGDSDVWVLKLDGDVVMDASCTFGFDTNISPFNTSVVPADTSVIGSSTSATITNTAVSGIISTGTDTLLCHGCKCPADSPNGCISGDVTNLAGEPIAGKTMILRKKSPLGWRIIKRDVTDSNGCYLFTDLKDGKYKIGVRRCRGGDTKTVVVSGGKVNDVNFECR